MSLALLDDSENTEANEVGALPENVGQFEEGRVDQNRERILGEESWKLDDGFALFAWAECYKTFYGHNLRTFVISKSVFPGQAFPA
jgi:hypothetical protein